MFFNILATFAYRPRRRFLNLSAHRLSNAQADNARHALTNLAAVEALVNGSPRKPWVQAN
ncbi:MAG: hypothetical protein ACJAR2_002982 [Ilumatobacter sp.]|jgi:hypothetical protein